MNGVCKDFPKKKIETEREREKKQPQHDKKTKIAFVWQHCKYHFTNSTNLYSFLKL